MTPDPSRRTAIAMGLLMGAATIIDSQAKAEVERRPTMADADNYPCGRTDEGDLSAADASLPPRVRLLIRIGVDGIAHDNAPALRAFFHPDYRFHGPGGAELDREALWAYFARCRAAFDSFSVTRQAVVTDGADYIACRTRFAGRFVRPFAASPDEKLEPNGRQFEYRLINIFRYASDGRLAEEWAQYDVAAFMVQLRHPADGGN